MDGRLPPRRPTPKLYECYRRGWHSEEHSKIRARMMRLILQSVLRLHQRGTTETEAFSVKLPRIVLRLEEIIYSRAKSQAEYEEEGTVISRLNEAVSTIVGGEDGPLEASDNHVMKPCVEAALSLSTVASPRPPRIRGVRKYAAASTQGLRAIRPNVQSILPNPGFRVPSAASPSGVTSLERRPGERGFSPLGPGQPPEGGGGVPDFPQPQPMRESWSEPVGRTPKSRGGDGSGGSKRDRGGRGGGGTGGKQVPGQQQLRRLGGPPLGDGGLQQGGGQLHEIDFGLRLAAERVKRQEHAEPRRLQGGGRGEQVSVPQSGGVSLQLEERGGKSPMGGDRGDTTALASLLTLGGGQQQFGMQAARPSLPGSSLQEQHGAVDAYIQLAGGVPVVPALVPGGRPAVAFDLWAGHGAGPTLGRPPSGATPPGMEAAGGAGAGAGAGVDFRGNAPQVPPATWLLFLRRACLCGGGADCVDHSVCERGQRLWLHLTTCVQTECGFDPMCVTSRALLQHLQDCQQGYACPICGPIAQAGNAGGALP